MCGISGFYCWGRHRPVESVVRGLILANEERGKDASGVAFLEPERHEIAVVKAPQKATDFVKDHDRLWASVAASPFALMHTRLKTKGDQTKNENNHPVVGLNWVVTHNGAVINDDELWEHYGTPRFADVDTSAIPLVLSQGNDVDQSVSHLGILQGQATIAAWSHRSPTTVVLFRGGADLHLTLDPKKEILYWSSAESGAIETPHISFGGLRFATHSLMPLDVAMILTPEGSRAVKVPLRPFVKSYRGGRVGFSGNYSTGYSQSQKSTPGKTWTYRPTNLHEFRDKPLPIFAGPRMSFTYCSYHGILAKMRSERLESQRIETCYGFWDFTLSKDDNRIYKSFKGTRAMRAFHKELGVQGLPIVSEGGTKENVFDNVLRLESLQIKEPLGDKGTIWASDGFICPWCGVYMAASLWTSDDYRCIYCHIRSRKDA